jgi:hypothetical protein
MQMTLVLLFFAICFLLSLFKGWMTLLLLPIAVVGLPLAALLHKAIIKKLGRELSSLRTAQVVSTLAFFLLLPGVDDTNDVSLAIGGSVASDSAAAMILGSLSFIAGAVALVAAIVMLILFTTRPARGSTAQGATTQSANGRPQQR